MRTWGILCGILALATAGARADDWPRFRGPNGTGTVADKDVPVRWKDENVLFKAKLPGTGHSSPIVVGERVFLLAATSTERLVVCLDAPAELIRERLARATNRPLAGDWEALLEKRRAAYAEIPHHVDVSGKPPKAIAKEIINLWRASQ